MAGRNRERSKGCWSGPVHQHAGNLREELAEEFNLYQRLGSSFLPVGTSPRILNFGLLRECMLTSQLIIVNNKMTKTVRNVETKKMDFWRAGHFLADKLHATRMA